MRTRILGKHIKDCAAMRNYRNKTWSTPWAYFTPSGVYADKLGRKRSLGGEPWMLAICNDIDCPAKIMVNETDILKSLPVGKAKKR
jgi:hypothetical protein